MDKHNARRFLKQRWSRPEDLEVYRAQLRAFRKKFGREMGPDDPFFFDPDADTPRFRSPSDVHVALDLLAMLMADAGVDASAIYAFKRTGGLFPTEDSRFSPEELRQWSAALDEYHEKLRMTGTN